MLKIEELSLERRYYEVINKFLLNMCYGWGLTALSVGSNFELEKDIFDLLIIDEAAQCEIGSIIPLMYRSKRIVCVGDPNQLKPINNLSDEEIKALIKNNDLSEKEKEVVFKSESFFDLIRFKLFNKTILLNEHYRCHPEIIDFNNQQFYKNKLIVKTKNTEDDKYGIFWINTKLSLEKSTNHSNYAEIKNTITAIEHIHATHKIEYKDIGVITPFKEQSDNLSCELKKISEDIVCGTIHKFQGDERDYIIINLCLHDRMKMGTKKWEDNERCMINVATSRAKKGLIIVGDYSEAKKLNNNVKALADYFDILNNKTKKNIFFNFNL